MNDTAFWNWTGPKDTAANALDKEIKRAAEELGLGNIETKKAMHHKIMSRIIKRIKNELSYELNEQSLFTSYRSQTLRLKTLYRLHLRPDLA